MPNSLDNFGFTKGAKPSSEDAQTASQSKPNQSSNAKTNSKDNRSQEASTNQLRHNGPGSKTQTSPGKQRRSRKQSQRSPRNTKGSKATQGSQAPIGTGTTRPQTVTPSTKKTGEMGNSPPSKLRKTDGLPETPTDPVEEPQVSPPLANPRPAHPPHATLDPHPEQTEEQAPHSHLGSAQAQEEETPNHPLFQEWTLPGLRS